MFSSGGTRGRLGRSKGAEKTTATEWVGGRLVAPMYVTEGMPFRPEIIIWLEVPADRIVGYRLLDPSEPAVAFSQTLLDAFERPMAGQPRRPNRIRVADDALAAELREAVPDIEVVVAATSELDGVLAHMSQAIRDIPGRGEPESYFEGGRVSVAAVKNLFRAAKSLWHVAPWKIATDCDVLRVDIPALGVNAACLSVLGTLGKSFGFLLFPSIHGCDSFAKSMRRSGDGPVNLGTTVLSLNFERGSDLPPRMKQEALKRSWPLGSPMAFPRVEHRDPDGMPRPLVERDVVVAAAVATSLAAFFVKHGADFTSKSFEPICESFFDENETEVRFTVPADTGPMFAANDSPERPPLLAANDPAPPARAASKVGRNDPCPCGSGRKLKQCCIDKESRPADAEGRVNVHQEDERIVGNMMRFAVKRFREQWLEAAEVFADVDATMQLFVPWSVYGFHIDGRPVVDWYLETEGRRIAPRDRAWLEAQQRSWLSVWEVIGVEPGKRVTVKDLLSGEEREVSEVTASKVLKSRDALLVRVVDHEGSSVFCGVHHRPLPPSAAAEVVRRVRGKLKKKTAIPVEKLRDGALARYMIQHWEQAVEEHDTRQLIPPKITNTDGDDLLLTIDHFFFEPASRAEVERRLSAMENVEPPTEGEPEPHFAFLKSGNAMHESWDNTVIGKVWTAANGLKVETNSIRRADALRKRIEKACSKLLRHRVRVHSDPIAMLGKNDVSKQTRKKAEPETDSPKAQQFVREYKEKHYAVWLDQEIPAFGGKTPREAVRTKVGRQRVDLLLKDIENHEARLPEGLRFDFGKLRRELGIDGV